MVKINDREINCIGFAYDGCHKIYLLEDEKDKMEAVNLDYSIKESSELLKTFTDSCELRFISNWKLTEQYVCQFEKFPKIEC